MLPFPRWLLAVVVLILCRSVAALGGESGARRRRLLNNETTDGDMLCDLYNTMSSTGKAKLTNWCGAKSATGSYVNGPCMGARRWLGVTCAVAGGVNRVTKIDPTSASVTALGGSLPTSIGGLDALTLLNLQRNVLSGSIPSSLGELTRLTRLDFSHNVLSSSIPSSLGALTRLTALYLSANALTGPVPASFCSLQPSIDLQVQSNPGLTCYPSCLSTNPNFTSSKDANLGAVCGAGRPGSTYTSIRRLETVVTFTISAYLTSTPVFLGSCLDARLVVPQTQGSFMGGYWINNGVPVSAGGVRLSTSFSSTEASATWFIYVYDSNMVKAVTVQITVSGGQAYAAGVGAWNYAASNPDPSTLDTLYASRENVNLATGGSISGSGYGVSSLAGIINRQPTSQPTGQPSTQPSSRPSSQPTSQPTSAPSQPTPMPTPVPTLSAPANLYRTYHSGPGCDSTPRVYDTMVLNQCSEPTQEQPFYHVNSCKLFANSYSVKQRRFTTDAHSLRRKCAGSIVPTSKVIEHAKLCRRVGRADEARGYVKTHCGAMEVSPLFAREQILLDVYATNECKGQPTRRGIVLNGCHAVHVDGSTKVQHYSHLRYDKAASEATASLVITLVDSQYTTNECTGQPLLVRYLSYKKGIYTRATQKRVCQKDPLHGGFFASATHVYSLSSFPTAGPTPAPSARPTFSPTGQPTRSPTGQPSRQPTSQPTNPTSQPTTQPTSRPSTTPVTSRGLVLQLDAATYSGSGNWVDSVSGLQFVPYGGPTYSSSIGGGSFAFEPSSSQYMETTTSLPSMTTWSLEVWHLYTGVFSGSNPTILTEIYASPYTYVNFALGSCWTGPGAPSISAGYVSSTYWYNSGSTILPTTGVWFQIIATFDGTNAKIFVNNEIKVTTSIPGTTASSGKGLRLMRRWDQNAPADFWGGSLGLVRIYNVALTTAEINTNWRLGKGRFPSLFPTGQPTRQPTSRPSPHPSTSIPTASSTAFTLLWASGQSSEGSDTAIFSDAGAGYSFLFDTAGTLRWRDPSGNTVWNIATASTAYGAAGEGSTLILQGDGNLVVKNTNDGVIRWAAATANTDATMGIYTNNAGCLWLGNSTSTRDTYFQYTYGGISGGNPAARPGVLFYCPGSSYSSPRIMLRSTAQSMCVWSLDTMVWWAPGGALVQYAFQSDGNFVMYSGSASVTTGTALAVSTGMGNALCLQADGNLVLYTTWGSPTAPSGTVAWASGTNGAIGSSYNYLLMDSAGCTFVSTSASAIWSTSRQVKQPTGATCVGGNA